MSEDYECYPSLETNLDIQRELIKRYSCWRNLWSNSIDDLTMEWVNKFAEKVGDDILNRERIKRLCNSWEIDKVVREVEDILAIEWALNSYYEFLALNWKWCILPTVTMIKAFEPQIKGQAGGRTS